ncbi:MAG: DNA internalization-related competence protein ComEC/Rec2 [Betaproteobacteria bacterium RBG_16_56_24]|nr:MAG: DNA internalization-related competence protein ComEC/Rec2 [Betaproteobacteria bacterium RBG_16_56_24]
MFNPCGRGGKRERQSSIPAGEEANEKVPFQFLRERGHVSRFTFHVARTLLLAAFACGLGFFYAAWQAEQRLAITLPDKWQGRDIEVIGVVAELPRNHERGQRFSFDVEQTLTPQASVPRHIYLSTFLDKQATPLTLHAGERWQFTLRLKQPHGTANPHVFDFEAWALENNLRAVGYIHPKGNNLRLDALADGPGYRIEAWRETIRDKFNATLGGAPYAGVLSALAIGDQSSIPSAQWQVFTRTGVNHLMSISGLHITMLASLGFALTYWLWRRSVRLTLFLPARKAAALAALLVALGYALLSGFAVPAQRTVYMVGAVAAALWLNRNFSLGQILGIALLGVLIPDPWAVISPGFWLSFGAVALILYVTAHRLGQPHWLMQYASVQWAMTIGLVPLLLGLFQQVSLVSPAANAIAIPLVSLAVVPLTLLGAVLPPVFSIWDAPLWLAHTVMGWTMALLEWLNQLPQAVWAQHAPPAWSVVAGMLGVLWILAPRGFPARWLGFLLLLPMFLNTPEPPAPGTLRLIVFDVGQGLAVAAQTRHHTLLYDAGPDFSDEADSGNRILIPALRAIGIAGLDGLILTHDDSDHTGGAASVMQAMPIGWLSSSLPDSHPLLQNAANTLRCLDGQSWQWDGVSFEILHPDAASYANAKIRDNNRGCVLRISIGDQHILLTADIEKESERQLLKERPDKLPANLLVVPHHGSKTSSTDGFIAAVQPGYAVFTVGYRNRFGHPKQEVVQRYAGSGAQLLRSDEDGAILVEMNAQGLQVESYRKSHRRYWMQSPHNQPESGTESFAH